MHTGKVRDHLFSYAFISLALVATLVSFQNCSQHGFRSGLVNSAEMSSVVDPPLVLSGKGLSQWIQENNLQNTDPLEIPSGVTLEIDGTLDLGILQVKGTLRCPQNGVVTLRVTGLQVLGEGATFECGTENEPFAGRLNIELKAGTKLLGLERSFVVMNGGTLHLHGRTKTKWQRINHSVAAGDKTIQLSEASNWLPGDRIALAPTSFDPHESEDALISSVSADGRVLQLQTPLKFKHWGEEQIYPAPSRNWNLEERAEIANLTRYIRILALGDPQAMDGYGGHVMVMQSGRAFVDSVEFMYMGQMGKMGSYPFHWHRVGAADGQYIRNSSIHHSFQRCVTVHGTNYTQVVDNVCYDHYGHGYFLEDGNEIGNRITGNLGIMSRRPWSGRNLLQSDIDAGTPDRWLGPATFWISHPSNIIVGNVAAGSEGTGFWNSFVYALNCDANSCAVTSQGQGNVAPAFAATTEFRDNKARSARVGMSWDGADMGDPISNPNNPNDRTVVMSHYQPPTMPSATGLTVSKSLNAGIYFRGQPYHFENLVLADNRVSVFFAYNQRIANSAIIGYGRNRSKADLDYIRVNKGLGDLTHAGSVWFYDGPLELTNIDFLEFPNQPIAYMGIDAAPVPFTSIGGSDHFTSLFQGLKFSPEPQKRFFLAHNVWLDTPYSMNVRDLDGSFLGEANSLLVYNHPINRDSSCVDIPNTNGMKCRYSAGTLLFVDSAYNIQFQVTRSDGASTRSLDSIYPEAMAKKYSFASLHSKIQLVPGFEYAIELGPRMRNPANNYSFVWHTESLGQLSPVMRLKDVGSNCSVERNSDSGKNVTVPSLGSLNSVRSAQSPAYFATGQDLYLKTQSLQMDQNISTQRIASTSYSIHCSTSPTINLLSSPVVFDANYYRSKYSDVSSLSDKDLLTHWTTHGISEGRQAIETFSVTEYLNMYPDLAGKFGTNNYSEAIKHYVSSGSAEGRRGRWLLSSSVFNPMYYHDSNADFSALSDDATLTHWLNQGAGEGRASSSIFYVKEYASMNPDVGSAYQDFPSMIKHFVQIGNGEGRAGRVELSPLVFDLDQYPALNPDLSAAGLAGDQLKMHWMERGISEGRNATANFSVRNYLTRYPDLQQAFGQNGFAEAVRHFVLQGSKEGRDGK